MDNAERERNRVAYQWLVDHLPVLTEHANALLRSWWAQQGIDLEPEPITIHATPAGEVPSSDGREAIYLPATPDLADVPSGDPCSCRAGEDLCAWHRLLMELHHEVGHIALESSQVWNHTSPESRRRAVEAIADCGWGNEVPPTGTNMLTYANGHDPMAGLLTNLAEDARINDQFGQAVTRLGSDVVRSVREDLAAMAGVEAGNLDPTMEFVLGCYLGSLGMDADEIRAALDSPEAAAAATDPEIMDAVRSMRSGKDVADSLAAALRLYRTAVNRGHIRRSPGMTPRPSDSDEQQETGDETTDGQTGEAGADEAPLDPGSAQAAEAARVAKEAHSTAGSAKAAAAAAQQKRADQEQRQARTDAVKANQKAQHRKQAVEEFKSILDKTDAPISKVLAEQTQQSQQPDHPGGGDDAGDSSGSDGAGDGGDQPGGDQGSGDSASDQGGGGQPSAGGGTPSPSPKSKSGKAGQGKGSPTSIPVVGAPKPTTSDERVDTMAKIVYSTASDPSTPDGPEGMPTWGIELGDGRGGGAEIDDVILAVPFEYPLNEVLSELRRLGGDPRKGPGSPEYIRLHARYNEVCSNGALMLMDSTTPADQLRTPQVMSPLPPQVLNSQVTHLRRELAENKRGHSEIHLKRGKIRGSDLARVRSGFDRPFQKRNKASRRDYAFVIGIDMSGSTSDDDMIDGNGRRISRHSMLCRLAAAEADLLDALGIPFCIMGHTSTMSVPQIGLVKRVEEPWGIDQRRRLAHNWLRLSGNLDGSTLRFYLKVAQGLRATDRFVLYHTDGAMPAEDYTRQVGILVGETKTLPALRRRRDRRTHVMAVAVSDAALGEPQKYGLDTVELGSDVNLDKAIERIVTEIGRRIDEPLDPEFNPTPHPEDGVGAR